MKKEVLKQLKLKQPEANSEKAGAKVNNGSKEEDWSTAPAENILFPETYLSSIKRVLENASQNASSALPVMSSITTLKTEPNTVKSLKGKPQNEDEEDAEDEAENKPKLQPHLAKNSTESGRLM